MFRNNLTATLLSLLISLLPSALASEAGNSQTKFPDDGQGTVAPGKAISAAYTKPLLITSTETDTSLSTGFGQLIIKRGSIVYAFDGGQTLAIFNLFSEPDGVQIALSNSKPINVSIGTELLLTRSSEPYKSLQPPVAFVCHEGAEFKLGDSVRRFTSSFTSLAAFLTIPELRSKVHSSNAEDKKLVSKIRTLSAAQSTPYAEYLVLYEKGPRTIHTNYGDVICAGDSVVYLCMTAASLAVYVLDEKGKDDVRISIGSNFIPVRTAEEVVVTTSRDSSFSEINPKTGIIYRSPGAPEKTGDHYVYKTEFLIQIAAAQIPDLRKLSNSHDPVRLRMLERILKNAAIQRPTADPN